MLDRQTTAQAANTALINEAELTVVRKSPIHGQGLFAATRIEKGIYVGTYEGPEVKKDGTYVLWVYDGECVTARDGQNHLRYLNHSDNPNAEFDGFELYTIKKIKVGEEITINYEQEEE